MWKKEHRRLDCWRASCCFFSFAAKVLEVPQEVMLPTNGPSAPVDRFLPFGGVQQLVALALFATPMLLQSSWSRSPCDLKLSSPAAEWRRTQLLYVHSRGKNIGEEDQYSAESAYSSVGRASGKVRTTDQHVVRPKNWDYLRKSAFFDYWVNVESKNRQNSTLPACRCCHGFGGQPVLRLEGPQCDVGLGRQLEPHFPDLPK